MNKKYSQLFLDFEVYSEVDLTERGGMAYARHESTMPVCMSYGFEIGPIKLWTPGMELEQEVLDHVDAGGLVYAHNATFDWRIWNYICTFEFGWPYWPMSTIVDTQALCQRFSLPGGLEEAGKALEVKFPKMAGLALIKRCCMPQPVREGNKARGKIIGYRQPGPWDIRDKAEFDKLYAYAIRDTESMREIVNKIPHNTLQPEIEQDIWTMTLEMNQVGLPCDPVEIRAVMNRIQAFQDECTPKLEKASRHFFSSPYQYAKIKTFCAKEGFPIDNCQGDYITDLLDAPIPEVNGVPVDPMPERVRTVLSLVQILGKTSTAKFKAFNNYMTEGTNGDDRDWRVHDTFCYHGAGPGRWAGRGVQPHNFPRAKSKTPDRDLERFVNGEDIDDPIDLAKKLLRSVIKAPKGYVLLVSDYSSIENRGLAWVALDELTLSKFRKGFDQYVDMAASRFGVSYEEIIEGRARGIEKYSDMRQTGKVIILGCGYQMGPDTYVKTAWNQFRMIITKEDATKDVYAYRNKYTLVVKAWKELTMAARRAVITGKRQKYGIIEFGTATVKGIRWLAMRLPSGKSIYYHTPRIEQKHIPGYEDRGTVPTVTAMGVDPYSKKWKRLPLIPGRITENAVQGTAREIMAHGMLNVRREMPQVRLFGTVHDEAVALIKEEYVFNETLDTFNHHLCNVSWAADCPIVANGFIDKRYRKD